MYNRGGYGLVSPGWSTHSGGHPQAERLYTQVDMRGALVVGTEQYGLSHTWLAEADEQSKLPMVGTANSLNVAVAATLLMYEGVRQRSTSYKTT